MITPEAVTLGPQKKKKKKGIHGVKTNDDGFPFLLAKNTIIRFFHQTYV